MSFFEKLLDFGIKALDAYIKSNQSNQSNQSSDDDDDYEEEEEENDSNDDDSDNDEDELDHEFFILNKYLTSIPKVHLNKLIEQLEYAKYDHSPYARQNRENRKRYYKQIRQTINNFATNYHKQKTQTAYSIICETLGLMELPSYELSYILRHDSNLCQDIRNLCDRNNMSDINQIQTRYAIVVVLNLISYDELY